MTPEEDVMWGGGISKCKVGICSVRQRLSILLPSFGGHIQQFVCVGLQQVTVSQDLSCHVMVSQDLSSCPPPASCLGGGRRKGCDVIFSHILWVRTLTHSLDLNERPCITDAAVFQPLRGVFQSADPAYKMLPKQLPQTPTLGKPNEHTTGHRNIYRVSFHLRAAASRRFTAEAADNTPPAAAEEPAEAEQRRGRAQEAHWSCDRASCPWPRPPGGRKELRDLGSCIEHSYHCCEENKCDI